MDLNTIFKISLLIAGLSDFSMLIFAIYKKRFSMKFLINFFLFSIYMVIVKIFAGFMITYFGIENSIYFLIIIFLLLAVTFAFIKYSLYLIKEEKEDLL